MTSHQQRDESKTQCHGSLNDVHLFIFRGFEEGVLGGAADHLVEGGAGSDHGIDAVFFFDLEVDEEGFA